MHTDTKVNDLQLPDYEDFNESIIDLNLTGSGLHGRMCGFLCAGADSQGEAYLRALLPNNKDDSSRHILLSLFSVYTITQQYIADFNFEFKLLLPHEDEPLIDRACAFSEWCEGFIQGLNMAGVGPEQFYEEEAQEAVQHITEFAELDTESIEMNEEDEKAFMEVSEYTRMAVLRLHADIIANAKERGDFESTH
ncbi:MAG: UPF0149 family protein [Legionella sp.]|nr:UPF0149 family protein [Legionella sp.]